MHGRKALSNFPVFLKFPGIKRHTPARSPSIVRNRTPCGGEPVGQPHPKTVVIQNPPARPLTPEELDHIYELPFTRSPHPSYVLPVPALEPVRFSVTSHRGCFGGCSFCAITHHQGRIIQSRSIGSIVREVTRMTKMPEFHGVVQDIGGPTANMYGLSCDRWESEGACPDNRCGPSCKNLRTSHEEQCRLLSAGSAPSRESGMPLSVPASGTIWSLPTRPGTSG